MTLQPFEPFHDWWDSCYESFTVTAEIMGFDVSPRDIQFSGFWSQGDGASFTGSYSYAKGAAKRIRAEFPTETELHAITDMLQDLQRRNFWQLTARVYRIGHHYSHSNTIAAECERDTQDPTDDSDDIVTDAARRLSDWLYSNLESEFEYQSYDDAGRQCGAAMYEAREHRKAYFAVLRDIRAAFKARRAPVAPGTVREFIRSRVQEARDLKADMTEIRESAFSMIDESRPGLRGWDAKYRDAWLDGYAYGLDQ